MIKRFCSALLIALCLVILLLPAAFAREMPVYRQVELVDDTAGLLSQASLSELNSLAAQVSDRHGCDVGIYFVRTYSPYSSIIEFTDDYFDYNGFGYGSSQDGILLVVTTAEREYWITAGGRAIDAFTDYGLGKIEEQVVSCLSSGDYPAAGKKFIHLCDDYLTQYESGAAYDTNNTVRAPISPEALGISGVIGLLFSGLPLRKSRKELETVRPKENASEYRVGPKITLTEQNDRYINNNIVRVPIPRNDDRPSGHGGPGGHGGGSSIHFSSSGSMHGGHGGHF